MASKNKYPRKPTPPDAAQLNAYAWYGALVGIVIVLILALLKTVK